MDNLNPHLAGAGTPKYTWQVKLPNVECTNCTLQVIQVMEDDGAHGPYDPTPGVGVGDIYHQCIDLVLKKGAASNGDGGAAGSGGSGGTTGGGGSGGTNGGTGAHGGCTFGGAGAGAGAFVMLALLGTVVFVVRRRRA
jgi:hypothetical protein